MAATVLIYHMEEDRRQILEGLCHSMDIRPVSVDAGSHHAPIGLLSGNADLKSFTGSAAGDRRSLAKAEGTQQETKVSPISEEMIVMCGFTRTQFDTLLDALKMAGLRIGLKAVETPTNQMWSGEMLQEELAREREAFRKRR